MARVGARYPCVGFCMSTALRPKQSRLDKQRLLFYPVEPVMDFPGKSFQEFAREEFPPQAILLQWLNCVKEFLPHLRAGYTILFSATKMQVFCNFPLLWAFARSEVDCGYNI